MHGSDPAGRNIVLPDADGFRVVHCQGPFEDIGYLRLVEVDILKAIAEGVGGGRPISTVKPGPKPKTPTSS
jgi:hypothetical protein